jgi:Fuc2NAc and GlcNAc transferase
MAAAMLVATLLAALALTSWTRRTALRRGLLDRPNERSSHSQPTPRGGGLAIVIGNSLAVGAFALLGFVDGALASVLIGGGLLVAAVGFLDDRRSLPPGARFLAHVGAAVLAVRLLGGMPAVRFAGHVQAFGAWGDAAAVVAVVWVLNLFNFMDGIDGIAASEAVFITAAGGALALGCAGDPAAGWAAFALCAATLGFLRWNWPPAKIFMGDVGSAYLGYAIAVIGLAAGRGAPSAVPVWLALGGLFFADATITLFARLARGERIHLPHRDHGYQRLAVRWGAHRPVTLLFMAANLVLMLPAAVAACLRPELAAGLAGTTLVASAAIVMWMRR